MRFLQLLLICLLLSSCLVEGTDTGNPGIECDSFGDCQANSDPESLTSISAVVDSLCLLINECEGPSTSSCQSSLYEQDNIDTEVGLDDLAFASVQEIINAERQGLIQADLDVLGLCIEDIEKIDCSDSGVDDSFDPGLTNPYEKTANVIPVSCSSLYD